MAINDPYDPRGPDQRGRVVTQKGNPAKTFAGGNARGGEFDTTSFAQQAANDFAGGDVEAGEFDTTPSSSWQAAQDFAGGNTQGGEFDTSPPEGKESDLPRNSRSGSTENPRATISVQAPGQNWSEPSDLRSYRQYPYNQVRQSESGHTEEWDDTPGNERILTQHKDGSFVEMRPGGDVVTRVQKDRYSFVYGDDFLYVDGDCKVYINGNASLTVNGDFETNVKGDYTLNVGGSMYTNVTEGMQTYVGDNIEIGANDSIQLGAGFDIFLAANDDIEMQAGDDIKVDVEGDMEIATGATYKLRVGTDSLTSVTGNSEASVKGTFLNQSIGKMTIVSDAAIQTHAKSYSLTADDSISQNTAAYNIAASGDYTAAISGEATIGTPGTLNLIGTSAVEINPGGPPDVNISAAFTTVIAPFEAPSVPQLSYPVYAYDAPIITANDPDFNSMSTQNGSTTHADYNAAYGSSSGGAGGGGAGGNRYSNVYQNSNTSSVTAPLNLSGIKLDGGIKQLLAFIGKGEGSYNASNQGTSGGKIVGSTNNTIINGKTLLEMTIGQIMELQRGRRGQGRALFAVGRYQIIPETMRAAFKESGLTANDLFNEENQDKLGLTLLIGSKRPKLAAYLKGQTGEDGIFDACMQFAMEWASIPRPDTGQSYYPPPNRASHSVDDTLKALRSARDELTKQGAFAPGAVTPPGNGQNGRLGPDQLGDVGGGKQMRKDAAEAFMRMKAAAARDGVNLVASSAYRTYDHQNRLWQGALAKYGSPAVARKWVAPPGNSNHGWGLAFDEGTIYGGKESTPQYRWLATNAAAFGYWQRMKWEPWHWEFRG